MLDGSVLLVGEAPELPATPPRYELRYFDTGCWSVEAGEVAVTLAGDRPLDTADYAPRPSWLEVIPPNVLAAR